MVAKVKHITLDPVIRSDPFHRIKSGSNLAGLDHYVNIGWTIKHTKTLSVVPDPTRAHKHVIWEGFWGWISSYMTGPTKPKVLLAEMVPRGNDVRKLTPHMGLNKKQKKNSDLRYFSFWASLPEYRASIVHEYIYFLMLWCGLHLRNYHDAKYIVTRGVPGRVLSRQFWCRSSMDWYRSRGLCVKFSILELNDQCFLNNQFIFLINQESD